MILYSSEGSIRPLGPPVPAFQITWNVRQFKCSWFTLREQIETFAVCSVGGVVDVIVHCSAHRVAWRSF